MYPNLGYGHFEMGWLEEARGILTEGLRKFPGDEVIEIMLKKIGDETDNPDKGKKSLILSGAIDLVYKSNGGWTIVDYKTDDVRENLKGFVDYYSPQVKAYSRFWEEMSGEKVVKAGLYFTQTRQFVPVVI